MGEAAYKLVRENRGAVALTMELIANALKNTPLNKEMQARNYEIPANESSSIDLQ
jgi:hypothetical protein